MLSPQIKQVVDSSAPTEVIAFLVSIRLKDEMSRIAKIADVSERRSMLVDLYQEVKQPLFETISKYRTGGMRVVNELTGSPQLIVSGPARTWQKILNEDEPSLNAPNVVFSPNTPSWHVID